MIEFHHSEFEKLVSEACALPPEQIGEQDLLKVIELDCSNFGFCHEDISTLIMCRNLKSLCLEMGGRSLHRFSKVDIW